MDNVTIGVDLAKRLFSVCEVDAMGQVVRRKDMGRKAFALWLVQVPAGTVVAMEACGSAHYWARQCLACGLEPKLMAAHFVTPFRKCRAGKNDRNDAEAIATAARQGNMRFVAVKSVEQQTRLAWHRVREGYKTAGLAVSNRIRGLLMEFGIVVPQGDRPLRLALMELDNMSKLPGEMKEVLHDLSAHWTELRQRMAACGRRIELHADQDARCQRLRGLTGVGPITADAAVATIGDGRIFRNGRQLAAWLGLVPSQHSSGGHTRLGRISSQGDTYLRTVLVQGARNSWLRARKTTPARRTTEQAWINDLSRRLPFGKVLVAIANKHARQIWAMLAHDQPYDPEAGSRRCPWLINAIPPPLSAA